MTNLDRIKITHAGWLPQLQDLGLDTMINTLAFQSLGGTAFFNQLNADLAALTPPWPPMTPEMMAQYISDRKAENALPDLVVMGLGLPPAKTRATAPQNLTQDANDVSWDALGANLGWGGNTAVTLVAFYVDGIRVDTDLIDATTVSSKAKTGINAGQKVSVAFVTGDIDAPVVGWWASITAT